MSTARAFAPVLAVLAICATLPLATASNTILNGMVATLIVALAGIGWNLLAGYGGQFSFGHAAFFGSGAYAAAILQQRFLVNAWAAFGLACVIGAMIGWAIGYLSFRSGLRGSYFALVTLAFAEVFRIIANASPFFGGAPGILLRLDMRASNFQFESRAVYYWIALALVGIATLTMRAIDCSRLGAYLSAIRENEDTAKALGIDTLKVKLQAITLSAAITAASGAFYVQYFLLVNAEIGFGTAISIQALLAPIIGGLGTVFGPLLGALALHELGEFAKSFAAGIPGIDTAVFGALLILVIAFSRGGIQGALTRIARGLMTRLARISP
ncbi:MAG: branched-chain amino acid ABC transporter permease [Hyphomicrobiales bacterium]